MGGRWIKVTPDRDYDLLAETPPGIYLPIGYDFTDDRVLHIVEETPPGMILHKPVLCNIKPGYTSRTSLWGGVEYTLCGSCQRVAREIEQGESE